jgi:ParG
MSKKTIPFGSSPQLPAPAPDPEQWVKSRSGGKKKRLTFEIPAELHARVKAGCARRGTSMVAEIEALLDKHFPA